MRRVRIDSASLMSANGSDLDVEEFVGRAIRNENRVALFLEGSDESIGVFLLAYGGDLDHVTGGSMRGVGCGRDLRSWSNGWRF